MWIARDSNGSLMLFLNKPIRGIAIWKGIDLGVMPISLFPNLTWKDEPIEVELRIKEK